MAGAVDGAMPLDTLLIPGSGDPAALAADAALAAAAQLAARA